MNKFVLLFLLFCPLFSHGFVNIESLRQSRQEGWYGSTGLSTSGSKGNVDLLRLGLNTLNIHKTDEEEIIFSGIFDYGESNGGTIINNGNAHVRYAKHLKKYLQWEVFSQLEFNKFQRLDLRTINGGGLRWRLYNSPKNTLFLGTGLFYEDEAVIRDADQSNFRGNLYVSYRKVLEKFLELTLTGYYQPSHKTFLDYRVRLNFGLEISVSESFKWTNEIRYFADTRPPQGVRNEDLYFVFGFNLSY